MATFDAAVDVVLQREGGYSNDPADAGQETNFGISKRAFPEEDIPNLTEARAREIYRVFWWDRYEYWRLEDQKIATKVFDLSVNTGPSQAHKLLQRAVRASTGHVLRDDGILGPVTLSAANMAPTAPLLAALRSEAAGFYRVLVAQRPTQGRFIGGWLRRAYT